jgi:hypothetical protein
VALATRRCEALQQLCGMLEQALGALQAVRLTSNAKRQRV